MEAKGVSAVDTRAHRPHASSLQVLLPHLCMLQGAKACSVEALTNTPILPAGVSEIQLWTK
jgi:hypothetical protein